MRDPDSGPDRPAETPRPRVDRRLIAHALFAVVGIAALILLVRVAGTEKLLSVLRASVHWLPVLVALELVRIPLETAATYLVSGSVRRAVRPLALVRMHVVAYAIANVMPAGRATSEAVKAAMLSRDVGAPRAAAIAATNQAIAMLGGAVIAVPCAAVAARAAGASPLAIMLVIYAIATAALFAAVQIAYRRRGIGGLLLKRFARAGQATMAFQDAILELPVVPRAIVPALAARAVAVVEYGVLLFAVGGPASVGHALLANGVSLVGGAVGDLVPGQLGATDGALALAAPALGVTVADAIALSVMMHAVQLGLAAVAVLVTLVWRADPARSSADLAPARAARP